MSQHQNAWEAVPRVSDTVQLGADQEQLGIFEHSVRRPVRTVAATRNTHNLCLPMVGNVVCSVGLETLISIFSQENQFKVIRTNHIHKSRIDDYCMR